MNGYDDISFLAGITDGELREIGVRAAGHRAALMQAVRLLPDFEIEPNVPVGSTRHVLIWSNSAQNVTFKYSVCYGQTLNL